MLEKLSAHVEAGRAVTFAVVDPNNADWLTAAFPRRTAHVATLTGACAHTAQNARFRKGKPRLAGMG